MTVYDPLKHHRRSIRLQKFDYSQTAYYFVTICVRQRRFLLGRIEAGIPHLSDTGNQVEHWLHETPRKFAHVALDSFVIMPNHLHVVFELQRSTSETAAASKETIARTPLPQIVQWFKTMTTNARLRWIRENDPSSPDGLLWQRNYYEHVVRDEYDLLRIREYIRLNPTRWTLDRENPDRTGEDEFDLWLDSVHDRPDDKDT